VYDHHPHTEVFLNLSSLVFTLACALTAFGASALAADLPQSAFLAPVGQSAHYRFTDALKTPNGDKDLAGTMTVTTVDRDEVQLTIARRTMPNAVSRARGGT
jgi:hypothetical protein